MFDAHEFAKEAQRAWADRMRPHLGWQGPDGDGIWVDETSFCQVEQSESAKPREVWLWSVVITEHFISGPYPGAPDWKEYDIGQGECDTLSGAMWAAQRKLARTLLMEDIHNEELDRAMAEQEAFDRKYDESFAAEEGR